MRKYLPPNAEGLKPYTVVTRDWGREESKVVYAEDAQDAKRKVLGRGRIGFYVVSCLRTRADEGEPKP